jgi:hypothetical protein
MKLRLAETVNRLNVEHQTPNIDDASLDLLKKAIRSLRRAFFWPAAVLNPEPLNPEPVNDLGKFNGDHLPAFSGD